MNYWVDGIPTTGSIYDFLLHEANGILAFVLGKNEASDVLEIGNRVIRRRQGITQQNRRIATVSFTRYNKKELQRQAQKLLLMYPRIENAITDHNLF